jgi:hypothetical protein
VSIQIGEQLKRRQGRVRALASVSDGWSDMAVEPVPRIALTQQEACASLGCSEEFFVEHVRPHLRVARSDGERALVKQGSTAESSTSPANLVRYEAGTRAIGRSSQRTSPALMLASSFGGRGGFWGA